jgi:hypothetical protein
MAEMRDEMCVLVCDWCLREVDERHEVPAPVVDPRFDLGCDLVCSDCLKLEG